MDVRLFFGREIPEANLPPGFRYVLAADDWVMATDRARKFFYVGMLAGRLCLFPMIRKNVMDTDNPIFFQAEPAG